VLEDYEDFEEVTNTLVIPVLSWLADNPTKRPSHYLLFYGIPNRTTDPVDHNKALFSSAAAIRSPLSGRLPLIDSLNMATTNDCIAYIDKLAAMGGDLPFNRVLISATAAGYESASFVLDNVRDDFWTNYVSAKLQIDTRETLVQYGVSQDDILYADNWAGVYYSDGWPNNPFHIRGNQCGRICLLGTTRFLACRLAYQCFLRRSAALYWFPREFWMVCHANYRVVERTMARGFQQYRQPIELPDVVFCPGFRRK
jgi:hypothetical protein